MQAAAAVAAPVARPRPVAPAAHAMRRARGIPWPWQGVEWSVSFVALCGYVAAVTTYALPIGQESMLVALVALPFSSRDRVVIPGMLLAYLAYYATGAVSYFISAISPGGVQPLIDATKLLLITVVALAVINTRARLRFFTFFYLACFALFPLRGALFNAFIYRAATEGRVAWNHIFANPNDFSALLLFPLGLSLGLLVTERDRWIRRAAGLGGVLIPLAIFLTQSRGTILALGVVTVALVLTLQRGRGKALLGLAVLGVVLAIFAPKGVWERLLNFQTAVSAGDLKQANDSQSARQRAEIMKIAWTIGRENLSTGVGLSNYERAHRNTSRRGAFDPIGRGGRDAHSTYLSVLAETGVVGVTAFVAMLVLAWGHVRAGRRRISRWSRPRAQQLLFLELGLAGFMLTALIGTYDTFVFLYLQVVMAWRYGQQAIEDADWADRQRSPLPVAPA